MDAPDNKRFKMTVDDPIEEEIDLGRFSKPEAPSLETFLAEPFKYRPRNEFLEGAASYVEDETILTHACKLQNGPAVAALLEAGADPNFANKKGVTPISAAAHKGNIEIMQSLINTGSNVNALNSSGSTALIQASHFGHVAAVQLLVKHHASADFANHKGTTALMRASQEGHLDISDILLISGADVNRKNHEGMNALMLASQRGHADMVMLLIKKDAVMDEQTSQGSTALMLACKRGHVKCVEVLVAMGAEIFIRDTRGRTASDTAFRRGYLALIPILNTQAQILRRQEYCHKERTQQLLDLRFAHQQGLLRLSAAEENVHQLTHAVKMILKSDCQESVDQLTALSPTGCSEDLINMEIGMEFPVAESQWQKFHPSSEKTSNTSVSEAKILVSKPENAVAVQVLKTFLSSSAATDKASFCDTNDNPFTRSDKAALPEIKSSIINSRQPEYLEWQWPVLLQRCMDLPPGVFELIADMLPLPRLWQWSLMRLKRRCKLSPYQAVCDMNIIMDEILLDSCIFSGSNQKSLLVRINRNSEIYPALKESWGISPALLEIIREWSDVQSMLHRTSEGDVSYRHPFAKKMYVAAKSLYEWYSHRHNSVKALGLETVHSSASGSARRGDIYGRFEGEEFSDIEGVMDQDTETELPAEGDADDAQDDEDDSDVEEGGGNHAVVELLHLP